MSAFGILLFYGWTVALIVLGAAGALAAPWELRTVFHLDVAGLDSADRSTLLNHYRFLKALELGVGAVCLARREQIFTIRLWNRAFLALVFTSAAARLLSIAADGRPRWFLLATTAFECLAGAVIAVQSRRLVEPA